MTTTAKMLAETAMNKIKKYLAKEKKEIKERANGKGSIYFCYGTTYPSAEMDITLKQGWIGAKDEKYRLTINPYRDDAIHVIETDTRKELEDAIGELFALLNQQMKVRGWGNMRVIRDDAIFGSGWTRERVRYPRVVALPDAPCSEFKSLEKFLVKYGDISELGDYSVYHVPMGGKRGELYCEEGERRYLCNDSEKCAKLLAELRKVRSANDKMEIHFGTEKYIDPLTEAYSAREEIECDGEGRGYITITIKTPTRRVKYEKKVY